jgi:hypothetical protein
MLCVVFGKTYAEMFSDFEGVLTEDSNINKIKDF